LGRYISASFAALALLCACARVSADVGIVLNDSLDTSVARITGSGHSAIYLSRICPASPIKLRLCQPGEQGSVLSNYTTLGEDQPFQWNVVSFNRFVYGVQDPADRPLFASWPIKHVLEQKYRQEVLGDYCASQHCQTSGSAEWREMVGATAERTFYILIASTTLQQDLDLIAKFNSGPNVNHFNAATRNCADFTKEIINTYFPHAARRDILNDFGATSPKTVARTFAHYADHRPEIHYYVLHFAQLPGTIKRSTPAREGTEQVYRAKRLAVPLALADWHIVPPAAMAYFLTGKFDPQREFELHVTPHESELVHEKQLAEFDDDDARVKQLSAAAREERVGVVGSSREWKVLRAQFDSLVDNAVKSGIISDRGVLDHVFKQLTERGAPYIDGRGELWLKVANQERAATVVGLAPGNILAPNSDRQLAYQILLATANEQLKSSARRRETLPEFKQTWALLEKARTQDQTYVAQQASTLPSSPK
jgi:hypothetical protein